VGFCGQAKNWLSQVQAVVPELSFEGMEQLSDRSEIRPMMVVLHQQRSCSGRVGRWLDANSIPVDVRRPRFGDPLPETLSEHAGAIVFGGPMSVNDECEAIRQEIEWMRVPLTENKPLLGICLGAQILARYLGARIGPNSAGTVEVGYYPLGETVDRAQGLSIEWPHQVFQYHCEGFEVAPGARLLVTGNDAFPNQAFAYGENAVGLQFHPEVTFEMITRWSFAASEHYERPGARTRLDIVEEHRLFGPEVDQWLKIFLRRWIDGALIAPSR